MTDIIRPKPDEEVWINSMGKRFRLTAMATTTAAANDYMAKHDREAVIAEFGPLILIANIYAGERQ
jgi:hypothetical protein